MVAREKTIFRHPAEAALLEKSLEGDLQARDKVLQYLSSANEKLRQIMQETLHDWPGTTLWPRLLNCLALHRWEDEAGAGIDSSRRVDSTASDQIDTAIREAFIEDEHAWERTLKEQALTAGLDREEPAVRYAAACLFVERGSPEGLALLDEVIESGDERFERFQFWAIDALKNLKDERSGPLLLKAMLSGNEKVHHEAGRALNELGRLAVPTWMQALGHPDSHIRWHAARGLGQVGDPRAVHLLAEGLYDENRDVRWATANVLARLDLVAVPAILSVLSRHKLSEPLREAAYHALHAMPSSRTKERIQPLLEALLSPAANVEAPAVAQRLLARW